MYLAIKEFKKEKLRFLMIILVTALIAYLVYFLASLAFGLSQLNRTAVDYWDAKGVVVSKASNQNIYASSIDVETLSEVGLDFKDAINVANTTVYITHNNEQGTLPFDLVFLGFDLNNKNVQAPIIQGRNIENNQEIVLSSNFKEGTDIEINDVVEIATTGRQFTVVGFTENSNYNTVPVGYVTQEMASQAMMIYTTNDAEADAVSTPTPNMPERISGIIVYDDINVSALEKTDLAYISIDNFIKSIPGYQAQVLTFGLMIVALTLISAIIIGIFMYILTMQKKSIFGVLKIQGYQNLYIMKSVIYQSLMLIVLGFTLGLILTIITIEFLPASVPVAIFWPLNIAATLFTFICSFLGTLISARTILKIDPLQAI